MTSKAQRVNAYRTQVMVQPQHRDTWAATLPPQQHAAPRPQPSDPIATLDARVRSLRERIAEREAELAPLHDELWSAENELERARRDELSRATNDLEGAQRATPPDSPNAQQLAAGVAQGGTVPSPALASAVSPNNADGADDAGKAVQ